MSDKPVKRPKIDGTFCGFTHRSMRPIAKVSGLRNQYGRNRIPAWSGSLPPHNRRSSTSDPQALNKDNPPLHTSSHLLTLSSLHGLVVGNRTSLWDADTSMRDAGPWVIGYFPADGPHASDWSRSASPHSACGRSPASALNPPCDGPRSGSARASRSSR